LRVEAEHGVPLPCTLETLSKALKGAGLTYKRARFSLKKSATPSPLP
ncbi:transposase, partial [Chromobacterium alticapitis]